MLYYVYILTSDIGRYYVGYTSNIERRFNEHIKGNSKTTSRMGNLKLLGYFEFLDKKSAINFERKIKTNGHTERFISHINFIKL